MCIIIIMIVINMSLWNPFFSRSVIFPGYITHNIFEIPLQYGEKSGSSKKTKALGVFGKIAEVN